MTPFLASRSSRPSSATLERKNRIFSSSSRTTRTLPHKSVHFEDDVKNSKTVGRSISSKEAPAPSSSSSRFHLPWKRSKKTTKDNRQLQSSYSSSKSPESNYSPSVCDSPLSTRSAPSALGHSVNPRTHSPLGHSPFSSPRHVVGGAMGGDSVSPRSPGHHQRGHQGFDQTRLDNVYDLFAVCNHIGSMSRGHYTAYCRNPADGNWYTFDDEMVQPISDEQLVTSGAYMLFYVRQSLLVQSPLSGSDSSTSSGSSNHWIYHIPQFRLDLGSLGSDGSTQSSNANVNEMRASTMPRQRLNSANSAVSAPPITGGMRGTSPQGSSHDGSDVFSPPMNHAVDAHSAISLPPYQPPYGGYPGGHTLPHPSQTPQQHQRQYNRFVSYPTTPSMQGKAPPYSSSSGPPSYGQGVATRNALTSPTGPHRGGQYSGRGYASMRAGKSHLSPPPDLESSLKRGASFHSPRGHQGYAPQHHTLQRSMTDYYPPPPNPHFPPTQALVAPSRSIPNMPSEMGGSQQQGHFNFPPHQAPVMPSRSIPNMPAEMTPRPTARSFSEDPTKPVGVPHGQFFMTPQPRRSNLVSGNPSFSTPTHKTGANESCV